MPTSVAPVGASLRRPAHLAPHRPQVRRVTLVAALWPRPAAFDPKAIFAAPRANDRFAPQRLPLRDVHGDPESGLSFKPSDRDGEIVRLPAQEAFPFRQASRSAKMRETSAMFSLPQVHSGSSARASLRPSGVSA